MFKSIYLPHATEFSVYCVFCNTLFTTNVISKRATNTMLWECGWKRLPNLGWVCGKCKNKKSNYRRNLK